MSPTSYQLLHPATEILIIRQRLCVSSGKKEKTRKKKNSFPSLFPPPQNEAPPTQPARPQPHRRPKASGFAQTPQKRKADHSATRAIVKAQRRRTKRRNTFPLAPPAPRFLRRNATIAPTAKGPWRRPSGSRRALFSKARSGDAAGVGESSQKPQEALSRKDE